MRVSVLDVVDGHTSRVLHDARHQRPTAHSWAERRSERIHQRLRSTDDVAGEAAGLVPDHVEVAEAIARRDLLWLARSARQGAAEEGIDLGRERPEHVHRRLVVHKVEHPRLALRQGLARQWLYDLRVLSDIATQLEASAHELQLAAPRDRQAKGVGLDAAIGDELAPVGDARQRARNIDGVGTGLGDQSPNGRVFAGKDMRTKVEPMFAPRDRHQSTANAIGRLEHDDIAILEVPRGR